MVKQQKNISCFRDGSKVEECPAQLTAYVNLADLRRMKDPCSDCYECGDMPSSKHDENCTLYKIYQDAKERTFRDLVKDEYKKQCIGCILGPRTESMDDPKYSLPLPKE